MADRRLLSALVIKGGGFYFNVSGIGNQLKTDESHSVRDARWYQDDWLGRNQAHQDLRRLAEHCALDAERFLKVVRIHLYAEDDPVKEPNDTVP